MSGGRAWFTWAEVRLALRLARKQPVLNLTIILALAVGIGLAGGAFTLANTFLFSRLPLPAGGRFARLWIQTEEDATSAPISRGRFEAFRSSSRDFEYLGAMLDGTTNLREENGDVEPVRGIRITPDAFRVLQYRPLLGRTLILEDGTPGSESVALIGEDLWERRFGRDPSILGRELDLGGVPATVVGVLGEEARFPNNPDVWTALSSADLPSEAADSGRVAAIVFGVLRPGTTPEAATEEFAGLSQAFEGAADGAAHLRVTVRPFTEIPQSGLMFVLFGGLVTMVVLLLVVIAANVGNLVTARTTGRAGELAVRTALGASRWRLVAQLSFEVIVLGAVAAVLGWSAMSWGMTQVSRRMTDIPFWIDLRPGPAAVIFVLMVTALGCSMAGVVPALWATRRDPGETLRATGRGNPGGLRRAGVVMSVLEVAASVALVGTAVVMGRAFASYTRPLVDIPAREILTTAFSLPDGTPPAEAEQRYTRIEEVVGAIPGVVTVGLGTSIPRLDGQAPRIVVDPVPGEATPSPRPAPRVRVRPGFLESLGAAPLAGRLIVRGDFLEGAPGVAVVNESFVQDILGGRNAVGRRLRLASGLPEDMGGQDWSEIVGVVPDLAMSVSDPELEAGYYIPLRDAERVYLVARVSGDPSRYSHAIRGSVAWLEPQLVLAPVRTLEEAGDDEDTTALGAISGGLGALGAMALLLSLVSTYALVSATVSRRTSEIGIRVALGATSGTVLRTVVGGAALQVGVGSFLGIALGYGLLQLRTLFVFRVPGGDSWVLVVVAVLMIVSSAAAGWIPARRAVGIRPADALRAD